MQCEQRGPLAVVHIGSNTGRDVVRIDECGHPEVLEALGTPLRLVHELGRHGTIGEDALRRTIEVLRGFQAVVREREPSRS